MNREEKPTGAGPLQPLIAQATDYANYTMRKIGHIPPTLLAETPDGLLVCIPESMENEKAKDVFAAISRWPPLMRRRALSSSWNPGCAALVPASIRSCRHQKRPTGRKSSSCRRRGRTRTPPRFSQSSGTGTESSRASSHRTSRNSIRWPGGSPVSFRQSRCPKNKGKWREPRSS